MQSAAPPDEDETLASENASKTSNPKPTQKSAPYKQRDEQRDIPKNPSTDDGRTKSSPLSITEQVFKMSAKVFQHMQANARLVQDAVKDDFPGRTYAAGNRIIGEFGNTFDKTLQLMGKVTKSFFGDSNKPDDKGKR